MKNALMPADVIWNQPPNTQCDIAEAISLATTSEMALTWNGGDEGEK